MKILNIVLKVLLCLLLVSPILGALGILPKPTPDLYNTPEAFAFIEMLFNTRYILYVEAFVFAVSIALIIMNRMAIVALLILPITVNIIGFHLFLDGGLFTPGAVMADMLLLLNAYFLWQNREQYKALWKKGEKA
jgi:putative oxidoreductase